MASRKEQKEAARARRLAEEQARQERARRERRLRLLAGLVLGAAAVVAVAIAIGSGGGSSGLQTGKAKNATDNAVNSLLAGIPQSGDVLGNPSAKVTLTYFGDLECPICQAFTLGPFPQLVSNEVKSGKLKVVYRAFPTATRDPAVFRTQQVAALAAGKQDKFWNYLELFYHEQGTEGTSYVTEAYLDGLASQVPGLNLSAWKTARNDQVLAAQIQSEGTTGASQGITGTPTLIFTGPHGKAEPSSAVPSYSELQQDVKRVS